MTLAPMADRAGVIRTPDQRLRVFVSSTLRERAAERRVMRDVMDRMALAPVMFELDPTRLARESRREALVP